MTDLDIDKLSIHEIINKFLYSANLPMNFAKNSVTLSKYLAFKLNSNHTDYNINKLYDFIND